MAPFIVGVAGGTASGKTSVCEEIMRQLGQDGVARKERKVALIGLDSFYRALTPEESKAAFAGDYNFDKPGAFDWDLLLERLADIRAGHAVSVPIYDYKTHSRLAETEEVGQPDVVLLEGILVLFDPRVRAQLDMMLFVDEDSDTRLSRRALRDIHERGRDIRYVLRQYTRHVKPAFDEFIFPSKQYADIIIPRGRDNQVAVNLIVQHVKDILRTCASASATPALVRQASLKAIASAPDDAAAAATPSSSAGPAPAAQYHEVTS